eukprot:1062-Heterococcus_DN1.PRE.1
MPRIKRQQRGCVIQEAGREGLCCEAAAAAAQRRRQLLVLQRSAAVSPVLEQPVAHADCVACAHGGWAAQSYHCQRCSSARAATAAAIVTTVMSLWQLQRCCCCTSRTQQTFMRLQQQLTARTV